MLRRKRKSTKSWFEQVDDLVAQIVEVECAEETRKKEHFHKLSNDFSRQVRELTTERDALKRLLEDALSGGAHE